MEATSWPLSFDNFVSKYIWSNYYSEKAKTRFFSTTYVDVTVPIFDENDPKLNCTFGTNHYKTSDV
jgi:hypothetical protein